MEVKNLVRRDGSRETRQWSRREGCTPSKMAQFVRKSNEQLDLKDVCNKEYGIIRYLERELPGKVRVKDELYGR